MARPRIRLDHPGVAAMLKSDPVADAVTSLAEAVAERVKVADPIVRHNLAPVVRVETYTTDRAAAAVVIGHPAGRPIEAKHGTVARAAAEVGLEVRGRT